jgi:hypothetical protein
MAFTHSVGTNYCDNAGTVINLTETLTGQTAAINIDAVIPTEQTQEFDAAISVAKVQSLMICSDQRAWCKPTTRTPAGHDQSAGNRPGRVDEQ